MSTPAQIAAQSYQPGLAEVTPMTAPPPPITAIVLSQPAPLDLTIYRGDSGTFRVTVTDPQGAPLNVSTATWDADIRSQADSTSTLANLAITPVGGDTASIDISISPLTSSTLPVGDSVWDLQMTMGASVQTLYSGKFTVIADVSR